MDDFSMQVLDDPTEEEEQWLEEQIYQFNKQLTGYDDYQPLATFIRDSTGAIVAGLNAFTWGGTLRILTLWVREDKRKQGLGTLLLIAAEQRALTRGCSQAIVETHSFQAPQFYPARGYTVCGITDDNPVGFQQITFQKRLL